MTTIDPLRASCPAPVAETERVRLGHGSGGAMMAELIADVIAAELGMAGPLEDAAVVDIGGEAVLTTDSFVVTPRSFPGGDIGSLAVYGTVNDLAMRGARPAALALAYVIEEGLALSELRAITASVAAAARVCGVRVVTGDTKVVERGAADGIYLTTTGVGTRLPGARPSVAAGAVGDAVVLSGPIGAHGVAVLTARADLGFTTEIRSDSRPLHGLVAAMVDVDAAAIHVLRDPTRGGLASALNEIAAAAAVGIEIVESDVPVPVQVGSTCELLGLDPMYVANEGCLVALVAAERAAEVVAAMRATEAGAAAAVIGTVTAGPPGQVTVRTGLGAARVLDLPAGEQLPRIC